MNRWRHWAVGLAGVGAALALLGLVTPGRPLPLAAFVALVPFLLAVRGGGGGSGGESRRAAGLRGAALGLLYGAGCWWVWSGYVRAGLAAWHGFAPLWSLAGMALFCACNGVPYALFGLLAATAPQGRRTGPVRDALVFTALVCLYPSFIPANVSMGLYPYPALTQAAALGGAPLLCCCVALVNALLTRAVAAVRGTGGARAALRAAGAAAAVVALMAAGGELRLATAHAQLDTAEARARTFALVLVQPDFPLDPFFLFGGAGANHLDAVWNATLAAARAHPEAGLAVWPEVPPDFGCGCDDATSVPLVRELDRSFLFQCLDEEMPEHADPQDDAVRYNAARMATPGGCGPVYRKRRLVPFGETVPAGAPGWVRRLLPDAGRFGAGSGPVLMDHGPGARIGVLICYESFFSGLVRADVAAGANVLVNQVDDAWFHGRADETHFGLSVLRAVEFGVPLVRVGNAGGSGAVNAAGEIVPGSRTESGALQTRVVRVCALRLPTPYAAWGDWFLWCAGAALAGELVARCGAARRRRAVDPAGRGPA
ncbi:MAG: apolipoprotein N-acyltransferase [Desulfovibrionaceae bacterium]|jgi:apolipoprotein N-acyltransferase|nr:apolipoprotein N-acyltransferase [Desulfovibrionaceae bacterium]